MSDVIWGPGFVIDGKYRLVSKLGEGGMGAVWRADHLTLNAPVAVKLLDPAIAKTEDGLARFNREAQSAAALRGTHVVQTFDYGVQEGVPFIVMELLVGESLADRLGSRGPMPPEAVADLLKQVARAIGKAHQQGIVHRDLKPDNIFLVESDDDGAIAKVLDFGIAKATNVLGAGSTGSKTRTGALLGTPYYMSPEQAQGTREVDYRTDLWALGVIAFECLSGKRPFDSEALGDLLLRICAAPLPVPSEQGITLAGFDAWFARAASREPTQRFGTAQEMAKAFEALVDPARARALSIAGVSASGADPAPRGVTPAGDSLEGSVVAPSAPGPSRRLLVGATLGAAVGVLGLVGALAFGGEDGADPAPSGAAVPAAAPQETAQVATPATPPAKEPEAPAPEPAPAEVTPAPAVAPSASAEPLQAPARPRPATTKPAATKPATTKPATTKPATTTPGSDSFDPLLMRR